MRRSGTTRAGIGPVRTFRDAIRPFTSVNASLVITLLYRPVVRLMSSLASTCCFVVPLCVRSAVLGADGTRKGRKKAATPRRGDGSRLTKCQHVEDDAQQRPNEQHHEHGAHRGRPAPRLARGRVARHLVSVRHVSPPSRCWSCPARRSGARGSWRPCSSPTLCRPRRSRPRWRTCRPWRSGRSAR